jgi:hypothetical protein
MPSPSGIGRRLSSENKGETMTDDRNAMIPVWTLATGDVRVPALAGDERMTA